MSNSPKLLLRNVYLSFSVFLDFDVAESTDRADLEVRFEKFRFVDLESVSNEI